VLVAFCVGGRTSAVIALVPPLGICIGAISFGLLILSRIFGPRT